MSNGSKTTFSLSDTYNSIEELPYWNWDKVIQTGDLRFLCKGFNYSFSKSDKSKAIELNKFIDSLYKGKEDKERELTFNNLKESKYLKEIEKYNIQLDEKVKDKIIELGFENHNILVRPNKNLTQLWWDLQDEHMAEFMDDNTRKSRMRSMKKLFNLNMKFIKTRDRSILNLIAVEEQKQKDAVVEHMSMWQLLDIMTTKKGFDIDPKKYTVIKWYYTLKNIADGKENSKG
jgi:hypothetical protein